MPDFNVIKRNGTVVPFDPSRIENAIKKAIIASHENMTYDQIDNNILIDLVYEVYKDCQNWIDPLPETTGIGVEKIQDFVERELIKAGFADTAKEYILYRQKRNEIRNSRDSISSAISELLGKDSSESDLKRDNGNVNGDGAMGTMLQIGSNVSKAYYLENDINKTAADNHRSGRIHIHDLDFYKLTVTCCQIDCLKLFKNGFDTGHGYIREPNPISTYAALAAIAIQSDQNDCHGGQSIPNFDYSMAPGVLKSFRRSLKENIDRIKTFGLEISETEKNELSAFYDDTYTDKDLDNILNQAALHHGEEKNVTDKIVTMAYKEVNKQTYQAMEGFVHNLNSMHSRAGAQVPFSSINFGTDISTAGRMVIENLLLAIEAGLGHGETAIFPIAIFKVKEGVNYYPEDPNYDLFKLACRVSAKRLFPNFAFLDAPFNKQYYKEGVPESEVTYMGCVQGCEMITYKINDKIITSSFEKLWNEMSYLECKTYGISKYFETSGIVKIYDTLSERFVDCKKVIKNPNRNNWMHITLSNGQSINCTLDHPFPVLNKDTGELLRTFTSDIKIGDEIPSTDKGIYYSVVDIRPIDIDEDSYDVETESDRFDVSGIISHNCRSRVMGNVHDPSREQSHSRGNLSFTSINLPMIALESEGDEKKFYQNLHKALDVVKAQLLERFEIQAKRKVYNFPFLMGQGIWLDSEKLKWDDEVREVIKHGSLAIGFVGLAEALVALYGHHHGEGEEYWKKGYNIIKYMREYTDKAAEETKLNFAVIGTPRISGHLYRNI